MGLNASQLATYAGVSAAYVSRIERGIVPRPSAAKLGEIARVLGCEVGDLMRPEADGPEVLVAVERDKAPVLVRLARLSLKALADLEYFAGRLSGEVEIVPNNPPADAAEHEAHGETQAHQE